jgi:hypothetical protein
MHALNGPAPETPGYELARSIMQCNNGQNSSEGRTCSRNVSRGAARVLCNECAGGVLDGEDTTGQSSAVVTTWTHDRVRLPPDWHRSR